MRHRETITRRRDRARLTALVLLVAFAIGMIGSATKIGLPVEQAIHELRDAARQHRSSGRFVLIEIDARSLAKIDHWPWPRGVYTEAIDRLEQAGATTIAFDVDFSAPSTTDQDRTLANAIERADVPIILPTFRQPGSSHGSEILENLPIPALRAHAQLAAVNIAADSDGLVRHYPFGVFTAGTPRPSVAAMLAGSTGRVDASFPIDGAIDPSSIPRISFVDLIDGRVPTGALSGKTVLIGATAIELGDRYSVPRYGVIPGPVIQLLAAETLSAGSSPIDHGPAIPLTLALFVLVMALRCRPKISGLVMGSGIAAVLLLPMIMEAGNFGSVEIVPGLIALGSGGTVMIIVAIVSALHTARLTDPASGLPNRRGFEHEVGATPIGSVTVLRIANYSEAAGVIGQARAAEMIHRVVDRLAVAGIAPLYRLEDGVLAWVSNSSSTEARIHEIEGAAALLRPPVEVSGRQIELQCHFGFAEGDTTMPAALADRAILAVDHAVEKGTRWEAHNAALGEAHDWRLTLAGELDRALAAGDIWVAYQPKLDIVSGRVNAAEALVRWRHPERGSIPPDSFIPALETSGRILDLTLFVLRAAAHDAAAWKAAGTKMNVAVNVSALLTADEAFLIAVDEVLAQGIIAPDMLTLEVTESATLADPERAIAALERLASRGIKLSIDDYGTGQSTLTYLKRLPAREIKIDKSFVLGLENNRSDQTMVRSTIELAHELGYAVVAEGIETAAILEILKRMGCDTGQGWHIGKPMPANEFAGAFCAPRAAA
jgi:EAL domain-containing protein (putative c-di-GMP-specific phosphodiesterase class I)/CHASE2 domain-containing sensor protein